MLSMMRGVLVAFQLQIFDGATQARRRDEGSASAGHEQPFDIDNQ
jgi:hypothetical protein